jgi:hypothetical protein
MKLHIPKNLLEKVTCLALGLTAATLHAGGFGELPLYFEASSPARFVAQGNDAQFSVSPTEAQLTLQKSDSVRSVQMQFKGANPASQIRGDGQLSGKINHFNGNQPAQWNVGLPTFARVQVEKIYPGIDLVYYGNEQQLEYDFTVAAGADPAAIAMHFSGADKISINAGGDLVLKLGRDEMLQPRPVIYQTIAGVRTDISGGYQLLDAHCVAFTVGKYDHTQPLVIDPFLAYSTYFGGTLKETGWAIAVNPTDGSVYIAGQTLSKKAISGKKHEGEFTKGEPFSTPGAIQEEFGGGKLTGDGFVARFDSTGTNLIYLTYLGGNEDDFVSGIVVDAAGNAFVTGFTDSTNFPTHNALYPTIHGVINHRNKVYPGDAFVAELDPSGSNLVYSTYLGGSGADSANAIALDSSGNVYVTGTTASTDFPVVNPIVYQLSGSANPTLSRLAGTNNAFVTKIGPGGSNVLYSTYLGGDSYDIAEGIAVDASGSAVVSGFTISTNFPTLNAISYNLNEIGDKKRKAIAYDAFVSKLTPDGSALIYSTYLGSTNNDVAYKVASDAAGNAYVTGYSASPDFPNTATNVPGLYSNVVSNKNNSTDLDAFLTKFDPHGALVYSALFGGKKNDIGYGVAVDAAGDAFVVGTTASKEFPTNNIGTAFSTVQNTKNRIFVTAFNPTATALLYSGCLSGKKIDSGYSIAVDAAGNAFIVGQSESKKYPITNAFQPFRNGKSDAVLTKISLP